MDASIATVSVHLSTGLTLGKIIVVGFLVVVVDVRVDVVVVDCNLVVEDVAKIRLIRFAIFFISRLSSLALVFSTLFVLVTFALTYC